MAFSIPAHKNVAAPAGQVVGSHPANPIQGPDFRVYDHGSVVLVKPLTPHAQEYISCIEGQYWAGSLSVDHGKADDFINHLIVAGFEVQ